MPPSQGRDVGEQYFGRAFGDRAEVGGGVGDVGRVPVAGLGDDQGQARRAELLRLMRAVGDPSLLEHAARTRGRVACSLLFSPAWHCWRSAGLFEPVEHEQRPLDTVDLRQREVELVPPFVGGELAQHCRGRDDGRLERRDESDNFVPDQHAWSSHAVEDRVRGLPPDDRLAARYEHSRQVVADLQQFLETKLA